MSLRRYGCCEANVRLSGCCSQVGNGANMKLVVNMMMGAMMTTLGEGLTLAQKSGLSQTQLLEVLGLGVMANPMFNMKVGLSN